MADGVANQSALVENFTIEVLLEMLLITHAMKVNYLDIGNGTPAMNLKLASILES